MGDRATISAHTRVVHPFLVPELQLHLITQDCPLWHATPEQAALAGLQDPFWAFCWPGGQVLARYLLDHPHNARDRKVLDFGAGSGICALAAALAGAGSCLAVDTDPTAAVAMGMNAELNGLRIDVVVQDLIGKDSGWDLVLAGDMFYDQTITQRVLPWFQKMADRGALVLVGDPGRGFVPPTALEPVQTYRVPSDVDPAGIYLVTGTVLRVRSGRG